MSFNENSRVKIPAILHLCRLGYVYLPLSGADRHESTNIFTGIFAESIRRINPDMEEGDVKRVLVDISLALENEELGEAFYRMLTARFGVKLMDFDNLKREHFISRRHNRRNEGEFAKLFDDTLRDIAIFKNDIFSVKTGTGAKTTLFDELSNYITDSSRRDDFCRAVINQLMNFSFERIFHQKFDFFSTIFEYLIKDRITPSAPGSILT